ncbi:hypothetical protein FG379_001551 [Cryptosporidium bovis]|uniref:uncharacterized protein n=1 Tax=Cryptosporidium bovis TaxID=310047 RepID=UPI00351A7467|nr:hypothetical protein FG379_001551 [Cryptosporidium bovis]
MKEEKFSFSINSHKKQNNIRPCFSQQISDNKEEVSLRKNSDNEKYYFNHLNRKNEKKNNLLVFNEYDDDNRDKGTKVTMITSFSNAEELIRAERKSNTNEDDEYIIECKNSLNSENNNNKKSNIELLFKNRKRLNSPELLDNNNNGSSNKHNIPIEKFGLAMLKGMGYNPEIHNTKPKIYKKRNYNQSGLGANIQIKKLIKKR